MKKILCIILLFSFLYADDISVETSGNLETSIINGKKESNTLFDLNINNDFYLYEKTKIGTSVGAYITSDKTYNNNVRSEVNRVNAYRINELYITYYLTEDLMVSFGVFPFHYDEFTSLRKNTETTDHDLDIDPDKFARIEVQLFDWDFGHVWGLGNTYWKDWKAGEIMWHNWYDMPHGTANCGITPRVCLQVTGEVDDILFKKLRQNNGVMNLNEL